MPCISALSMRCATDPAQPWYSILAAGVAISSLWIATFWWFKVYGLAWQSMAGDSVFRAIMEYGLPIIMLFSITWRRGSTVDFVLAAFIWWLIGSPCKAYRERWRQAAIKHAQRFIQECGVNEDFSRHVNLWPLHLATIIFVAMVITVPGLSR